MNSTPRIGILGLMHESNTFAPGTTNASQFSVARGQTILERARGGNSAVTGFLETLEARGWQPVPLFSASATPGAIVEAATLDGFWAQSLQELESAGPLDGFLVFPHGAGVAQNHPDMDGWWLEKLRQIVGPDVPIIGVIDPHCNLTAAMLRATDALLPFKMNPHLDAKERGIKAAEMIIGQLNGEIRPTQKFCAPPLVINIERQHSESGPIAELYGFCRQAEARPGVLDVSVLLGFHYADVPEMNSGVLVITDDDEPLAAQLALELGHKLWEMRDQFEPSLLSPVQAIAQATDAAKPVCLLDMGDNIGGGGTGQGTHLLHELARHAELKTFFCVHDPDAVQKAVAAGAGSHVELELELGGHVLPTRDGEPFRFRGRVVSLPPHQYRDPVMRHGGRTVYSPGVCALLETDHLSVLVTTNRLSPNSPEMIPNCGLDAGEFDVIVAKGVNAPLGSFNEVCPTFIKVSTPGVTSADWSHFEFHNRRVPLFPLERDCAFEATLLP